MPVQHKKGFLLLKHLNDQVMGGIERHRADLRRRSAVAPDHVKPGGILGDEPDINDNRRQHL